VSISSNFLPPRSKGTLIASRVVPGMSNATRRSSPSQVLISVLLPTLGRPATARRIGLSAASASSSSGSGKSASTASSRLRMPWPCAADTGCGSPMPSSWNSASIGESTRPSALLTARNTRLFDARR